MAMVVLTIMMILAMGIAPVMAIVTVIVLTIMMIIPMRISIMAVIVIAIMIMIVFFYSLKNIDPSRAVHDIDTARSNVPFPGGTVRCTHVRRIQNFQVVAAGGIDPTAVAAVSTAAGTEATVNPGHIVRQHLHGTAIAQG